MKYQALIALWRIQQNLEMLSAAEFYLARLGLRSLILMIIANFSKCQCHSLHSGKCHMLFCCLLILSKSAFRKNSFMNTIRVSNSLDPNQARHCVGPDLGLNCSQRLSADDT